MTEVAEALDKIWANINTIAASVARSRNSIKLIAVSKTFSVDSIYQAYCADQRVFGESYVQEAIPKINALSHLSNIEWHMIGPIQSNKAKSIAENFSWVHSVDRPKVAQLLSKFRPMSLPPLNVCIQVNISGELSKHGIDPKFDAVLELARAITLSSSTQLRGLMGIAAPDIDETHQRLQFSLLRKLFHQLKQHGYNIDTLSMGMSRDMKSAIIEGATILRIGTAIFGNRVSI